MQFLLEYDEANVKQKAKTLPLSQLQRMVDADPRCSTWKAVPRLVKLFPASRPVDADREE
jgi:hypothetical protein